jgi:perosamine synthetase
MFMRTVRIGDLQFDAETRKGLEGLMDSSMISEGKNCRAFEEEYSKFIGVNHSVTVNSGTSALMIVLQALKYHSQYKLEEGKSIITTPLSYVATSNAVVTTGFKPVFVDINLEDFSLSVEQTKIALENDSGKEIQCLLPVHLMGYPVDMDGFLKLSKEYGIPIFEDSAEAHGSLYNGKRTGSMGLAGAFSFYIAHNIQVGEMGAVTTNDAELADRCHRLKGNGRLCYCTVDKINAGECQHQNLGFHPRYLHDMIGYNFKPMEYQAVVGLEQMKHVDWILSKRQENVKFLNDALSSLQDFIQLPTYSQDYSYLGYPLVVKDNSPVSRNDISVALQKAGIENRPIFNSIPTQQPGYSHFKKAYEGKVPNAEHIGNHGFYVGIHQFLSDEDLQYAADTLKTIIKKP